MRRTITYKFASLAIAALAFGGCGQDPSFLNLSGDQPSAPGENGSSTDTGVGIDTADATDGGLPPTAATTDTNGDGVIDDNDLINDGTTPSVSFPPSVSDSDASALRRCMAAWKNVPFSGFTEVNKVYANVAVGGFGSAVNDTTRTSAPTLTLVYAAVNVGSNVTYNFLNPNGYYCIKANVNVNSALTINLHCNARLADSAVAVNVGSSVPDATAQIGVHVNSSVTLNNVRPEGDSCAR